MYFLACSRSSFQDDDKKALFALQAESLPKSNQEAIEQPQKEVEPVISSVEKVQQLLQSAVDSLADLNKPAEAEQPLSGTISSEAPPLTSN